MIHVVTCLMTGGFIYMPALSWFPLCRSCVVSAQLPEDIAAVNLSLSHAPDVISLRLELRLVVLHNNTDQPDLILNQFDLPAPTRTKSESLACLPSSAQSLLSSCLSRSGP